MSSSSAKELVMRSAFIGLGALIVALAITGGTAQAATTRAEWVAQVDPICQNGQAQERVAIQPLISATKQAKKHRNLRGKAAKRAEKRLDIAFGSYFQQYALIERAVNAQITTIAPAQEDVSLVQVWLRARGELLDLETRLFTGGLKTGKGWKGLGQVFTTFFQLIGRQEEVADLVRDFGFQYCNSQAPSEFQLIA
jgi:hypothetical protein